MPETPQDAASRLARSSGPKGEGYTERKLHTYRDRDGQPIFWRIGIKNPETGDKWIRPMCRKRDGFRLGEPAFPNGKPVYRLDEIARRPGEAVIVCEGEACTDALAKLGMLATTSGAADSAGKADWSDLAGRDVVIWPDHDDAGARYGGEVSRILCELGCCVRMIDVAALGLNAKGDAVDWLGVHPDATAADVAALPCTAGRGDAQTAACGSDDEAADGTAKQDPGAVAEEIGAVASQWPAPQPLTAKTEPEDYPLDALPPLIRAAVDEVQGYVQAPLALVASSAVGAVSLACQGLIDVRRDARLRGPCSLYLLTIAESGERKSTVDGFFMAAVREFDAERAKDAVPLMSDHRAAHAAWFAKRGGLQERVREAAKKANSTAAMEADLRELEREEPQRPRYPQMLIASGDTTPEAVAYDLAHAWPSAGCFASEAGLVFGGQAMKSDSVMKNLSQLNIFWDGGSVDVRRRGEGGTFSARGVRLTASLMIQEQTLREFLEKNGALARGSGFLARFLIAWPQSTQGFRFYREPPETVGAGLGAFSRRLLELLNTRLTLEGGELRPATLPLDADAKCAWVSFHDAIEAELAPGGELTSVRDVASKAADNAARLAALFQRFEHGGGAVSLESFARASRIVAWHLSESRRFFGELALPQEMSDAARLDGWLMERCRDERLPLVSTREAQRLGPIRDKARLTTALRELAELDRVRVVQEGRRKSIEVNPALVAMR